jgi:fibronectin-binding autotransporter adhesin
LAWGFATLGGTPASAYTISVLGDGVQFGSLGAGETFEEFALAPSSSTTPGAFNSGNGAFSGSGVVANYTSSGNFAFPYGDSSNNYMAVLGGGSELISYSGHETVFGLYWGSVDAYNSLTFSDGVTIGGAQITALIDDGDQTSYSSNRYVIISGLPLFDSVTISSSQNAFEFDNVAVGTTPLPSTWSMMLIGLACLGFAGYRQPRRAGLPTAA